MLIAIESLSPKYLYVEGQTYYCFPCTYLVCVKFTQKLYKQRWKHVYSQSNLTGHSVDSSGGQVCFCRLQMCDIALTRPPQCEQQDQVILNKHRLRDRFDLVQNNEKNIVRNLLKQEFTYWKNPFWWDFLRKQLQIKMHAIQTAVINSIPLHNNTKCIKKVWINHTYASVGSWLFHFVLMIRVDPLDPFLPCFDCKCHGNNLHTKINFIGNIIFNEKFVHYCKSFNLAIYTQPTNKVNYQKKLNQIKVMGSFT